jgi:hypothetical protein
MSSDRQKTLSKEVVADIQCTEPFLPSVTWQTFRRVFFSLYRVFKTLVKATVPGIDCRYQTPAKPRPSFYLRCA